MQSQEKDLNVCFKFNHISKVQKSETDIHSIYKANDVTDPDTQKFKKIPKISKLYP